MAVRISGKTDLQVLLYGDIDMESASEIVTIPLDVNSVAITILSEGGSVSAALAIYDHISRYKVSSAVATGLCASSAILVLCAAKARFATLNTRFLIHPVHFLEIGLEEHESAMTGLVFSLMDKAAKIPTAKVSLFGVEEAQTLGLIQGVK